MGAIAPSSRKVAERIAKWARISRAHRVIELGAGTGSITGELLSHLPEPSRLLAIERHPRFAAELAQRFPRTRVVSDCASRIRAIASEEGFTDADAVVSTLPWSQFSNGLQRRLLTDIRGILSGSGVFVAAVCFGPHWMAGGQSFRHHLEETFGRVSVTPISFSNFPPLFIYVAERVGLPRVISPTWIKSAG